jgi:hypothetical protein
MKQVPKPSAETPVKTGDQTTLLKTEDKSGHDQQSKAVYRKPVLRRLGLLRSVAGSDPHW